MSSRAARDLGIERIGRSTRFLAVGSLVAAAFVSTAVAKAVPGRSGHPATVPPTTSQTATTAPEPTDPPVSTPDSTVPSTAAQTTPPTQDTLSPPVQAPQPTSSTPVVSSGGS